MRNKELSLYIHIPFCVKKCAYCDFLSFPAGTELRKNYFTRLCREIEDDAERYKDRTVISIFFGGGTPSVLPGERIEYLMKLICDRYSIAADAEISLECNPGTVDIDKFKVYLDAGINRLSIGCQSLDDKDLAVLGRIHKEEDFYRAFEYARSAGFGNINVDLMSALPGQTEKAYLNSLKKLIDLKPEHISAYSLIIEEGTEFYNRYHADLSIREKGGLPEYLPSEEEEREMLYAGRDLLSAAGYSQYEISNYSLPGYECRHNKVYWERGDYTGFGLGAASCVEESRWKNTEDINEYLICDNSCVRRDEQKLGPDEQRSEAMILGLRLMQGIDKQEFAYRYGGKPSVYYGSWIDKMSEEGLIKDTGDRLVLSLKGQDVANYVWGGFL
ncbi:MAG: radical SAM family heme chaperone HemW [Lachnospiraceae bacterium]|nr:radical SAM family heme chaperone HemW [Lachnospiraceae bacterium]